MIILCRICNKPITNGEKVTVKVITPYGYVPSTNEFKAKLNEVQFLSDTMAHLTCEDFELE